MAEFIKLKLNASWNYKVFIHQRMEELWLGGDGVFRTDAASFVLGKSQSHPVSKY